MIDRLAVADAILSSASDAVIAADRSGVVVFWNEGASRIFGYSSDETLGRSMDMIVPDQLRERHWAGYRQVMETGRSRYGEGDVLSAPALTRDGRRISIEFTIAMLRGRDGAAAGTVAVIRDVTKRFEHARELKRALAAALTEASGDA